MRTRTNFFIFSPNFLSSNYIIFYLLLIFHFLLLQPLFGQQNLPCYSIAKQAGVSDQLLEYNSTNKIWKNLGSTDTYHIESIAVDYQNSIIYTIDKGIFGTINPSTAKFTAIKELGSLNGAFGPILINDVSAITFDENSQIIYGVHRNGLNNAILFKVDPQSGEVFTNAFTDNDGLMVDYAKIEGVFFGSPNTNYIINIADIAFDSENNLLYVMYEDGNARIIANISLINGNVETKTNLIYKEISGIGFDGTGNLKATSLPNESLNDKSSLFTIDIVNSSTDFEGIINEDFAINYNCIDCAKKVQQIINCDIEINVTDYTPQMSLISASQVINSNANVTSQTEYKAVDVINLSSYFEVSANTIFSALIENTCE